MTTSYSNLAFSGSSLCSSSWNDTRYELSPQDKPKEKHFCKYCHTNSEKTNNYGGCVACGAPFGEDENKNVVTVRGGISNQFLYTYINTP